MPYNIYYIQRVCICCLLLIDNVVYRKKIYWNSLIHLAVRKIVGESRRFYWHFQSAKLSQTDKSAATNLLKIFLRFYYFYEQIQRQQSFIKLIDKLVDSQTKWRIARDYKKFVYSTYGWDWNKRRELLDGVNNGSLMLVGRFNPLDWPVI